MQQCMGAHHLHTLTMLLSGRQTAASETVAVADDNPRTLSMARCCPSPSDIAFWLVFG